MYEGGSLVSTCDYKNGKLECDNKDDNKDENENENTFEYKDDDNDRDSNDYYSDVFDTGKSDEDELESSSDDDD